MKTRLLPLAGLALAALLAACGGGGGSAGTPAADLPTVTSTTVAAAKYSQSMLVTLQGTHLDQGLTVTSAGCRNMALSSAAPEVSTSTTAYYRCTVSAVGAQTVTVTRSDGLVLPGASYTIEVPQVSMVISNTGVIQPVLVITLEPVKAPITTTNFLAYVNAGFYSGVVFHRSVRASDAQGFVVLQGGGYNGPLVAGSAAPSVKPPINANIVLEDNTGLLNSVMTLSMARSSAPDTANSQFFINLANNTVLDRSGSADFQRGYAVFGSITAGSSLLTALLGGPCAAWLNFLGSAACLPTPNLTIVSATQSR